ncbi:MAG: AAA family ATPase [Gammaproteobacteria bacterium]|nr:AAA family ATPase [Gammaproteobacteria bacterium]MCW5583810.1 AAA family ATPase [Gammaproteobacteria bacterium]
MKPNVIGISGVTGVGKTTLTDALAKDLKLTMLRWDDFDDISIGPTDYVDWYRRGRNYGEWDYQALADTLKSLKAKQSVLHPAFNHLLQPTKYIIFDAPLGRCHPQTGKFIDICVHIEVPLDISLCRRLLRDFRENKKAKEELLAELEYYLSHSRPLFFDDDLKGNADLVIDGMLSTEEQIKRIKEYLNEVC